ncbi:hypothetical protein CEK28_04970 [Xenophilus sp. AP218F]|nr:hypothetical protein CEK28_04970 [Xenophilus sp. AP218F]
MASLYAQALEHYSTSFVATLAALKRQQALFSRVEAVAESINHDTAAQAEACFLPPASAFIRLHAPVNVASELEGVCKRHQLTPVKNGAGWMLAPIDHQQGAILLLNKGEKP